MADSDSLKLAAFDLDGTLLDSAASIVAGVMDCWEACGFPLPEPGDIKRIIGLPWDESVRALLPGAGDAEFAHIRNYHDEVARGVRTRPAREQTLFEGVHDMLDEVEEAGFLLAIITSRSGGRLRDLLATEGIHHRFVTLKTTDNGPGKPNPHLMYQALEETGVEKHNAVMVGDTIFDMQMARNAGTMAVGVSWGVHETGELVEAGAHSVLDDIREISPTINRLVGGQS